MMNIYLGIILIILIVQYLLDLIIERLNIRDASPVLPDEFTGYYNPEKYKKSQQYLRENTNLELFKETVQTTIVLVFILTGGFNLVDRFARSFPLNPLFTGLLFAGILLVAYYLLNIPFSAYHTFVIEERYGFNRTTIKTFILDIIKSLSLSLLIGGVVFAAVVWFFSQAGGWAWFYCWVVITLFELFLVYIAPVFILPLFNKFVPLEDGQLKQAIENYATLQNFAIRGIFNIDASRRSTKTNAYFTGFGRYRKIALFDTLIQKHTVDELVSVLAHEVGHYRKKHIIKDFLLSVITNGIMFFLLSFFINNHQLSAAFRMEHVSVYASLVFFTFLYTPLHLVFSVISNFLSRKHEYEADVYAISTYKKPAAFINALKKLTVDNLGNLTPHHWKVFLHYSHPPILQRIRTIRQITEFSPG